MIRAYRLAVITLVGAGYAVGQQLDNGMVRLRFGSEHGELVSFLDISTGFDLVDAAPSGPLWELDFVGQPATSVRITDARRFTFTEQPGTSPSIELVWSDFPQFVQTVRAHVSLAEGSSISEWRIRVDPAGQGGPVQIDAVRFPRVPSLRARTDEHTVVPVWMGEHTVRARQILNNSTNAAHRIEWEYPGILSMQFLAVYGGEAPGVYFAANDSGAQRKKLALIGDGAGALGLEMVHLPEIAPEQHGFAQSYDCLVGPFAGDWFSVTERYREWGTRQDWAVQGRLKTGAVPKWVQETGIWVWNRGRSPGVVGPAAALQNAAALPVSIFWHWWHGCAYDTGFPEYLPPREGADAFRGAVESAKRQGLHAIVYMNQRLWGLRTESWQREGAERFAVKDVEGKPHIEVYNIFTKAPCAPMCMGTAFWRDTYSGLAQRAILDLGVDGIYMDQACTSLSCYDVAHGHAPGGGRFWMEGFRALTDDIRQRCADAPSVTLAGEGCGEVWLPYLDAMLSLQVSRERYAAPGDWEPLPLFQAVYHDSAVQFGNYSSLTYPPYDDLWPAEFSPKQPLQLLDSMFAQQFRLEQARSFLWGQQLTLANFSPDQLKARAEEIQFLIRLARVRYAARDFLQNGVMLRPPVLDAPVETIPMSRLSIYAGQQDHVKEFAMAAPMVLGTAWQADDGRIGVFVVNISAHGRAASVDAAPYFHEIRKYRVFGEEGEMGSGECAGNTTVTFDVPAQGVRWVEFMNYRLQAPPAIFPLPPGARAPRQPPRPPRPRG